MRAAKQPSRAPAGSQRGAHRALAANCGVLLACCGAAACAVGAPSVSAGGPAEDKHEGGAAPTGGGACSTARDCQLAGECVGGRCECDQGWTGPACSRLDLAPMPSEPSMGGAWNSESSPRSSWGADVVRVGSEYHGWFNELPGKCGLSAWLPGSTIVHGVADTPLGPFRPAADVPPPPGARSPLSTFATNPHAVFSPADGLFLLFYNGRAWPADDVTGCEPNRTGLSPWHGGGRCGADADCPGAFARTRHAQPPGACVEGACRCEHHSWGPSCDRIVETVNVATSPRPEGPWAQLRPDGAAFWADSDEPGGNATTRADPSSPDGGKALSNPSALVMPNGSVVLVYSRAPHTGVSVAPTWRGPYTRLWLPSATPGGVRNYSVAGCGEDPFVYRDFRGTFRILCHGATEPADARGFRAETIGMAFSTDLVHWTPGPGPAATSAIALVNGTVRPFARRERPALMVDGRGFPLVLYSAVQAEGASYSCRGTADRGCHSWSLAQPTRHGERVLASAESRR